MKNQTIRHTPMHTTRAAHRNQLRRKGLLGADAVVSSKSAPWKPWAWKRATPRAAG